MAGYTPARADAVRDAVEAGHHDALLDRLEALQVAEYALYTTPKKGTLGDSLLSVRFVRASGGLAFLRATFATVLARVPAAAFHDQGITASDIVVRQLGGAEAELVAGFRAIAPRPSVAGTAAAIGWAESDAGRYALGAVRDGVRDAYAPALADALTAEAEEALADARPMRRPPRSRPTTARSCSGTTRPSGSSRSTPSGRTGCASTAGLTAPATARAAR